MAAGMEGQYVRSLFVTLRRGWIGKPHFHQRVLAALGLHTRHQCVERPNNESIRGMLAKVSHLVIVETDRMFYLKRMRDYYQQCMREPIVVSHGEAVAAANARQSQIMTASPSLSAPRTLPASVLARLPPSLQQQQQQQQLLPPLHPAHSVLVAPHMHEHMQPLPPRGRKAQASQGDTQTPHPHGPAAPAAGASAAAVLRRLLKQRSQILQGSGHKLYSARVLELNKAIMEAREQQYQQEVAQRLHAIKVRQVLGHRALKSPGVGKGGRRGMYDETRAAVNKAASALGQAEGSSSAGGSNRQTAAAPAGS
uniref:Large ribosomal subunit protein uL30m n=1 Tax=Dunaliella tertiolecta TaxID=3047 RepID=A0A7S3VK90_DUNTE|mmetsp:Transcript_6206/g.16439  ORF Transcript_6206/g.16439 Transcript_6206/m.16439 type:complete len:310 (+) Transcript_6206:179-1108(+)